MVIYHFSVSNAYAQRLCPKKTSQINQYTNKYVNMKKATEGQLEGEKYRCRSGVKAVWDESCNSRSRSLYKTIKCLTTSLIVV